MSLWCKVGTTLPFAPLHKMLKFILFSKVLLQIKFFFYEDITQYASYVIFWLLPQGNRHLWENHKFLIIKYTANGKVVPTTCHSLLPELPIWNLHSLSDLIFKTAITFLFLVQILSNFHHSVFLIFLLSYTSFYHHGWIPL